MVKIAINQAIIAIQIQPWVLPSISSFFKNIPAPIDEPITIKTAEIKLIFWLLVTLFFVFLNKDILINYIINIINKYNFLISHGNKNGEVQAISPADFEWWFNAR